MFHSEEEIVSAVEKAGVCACMTKPEPCDTSTKYYLTYGNVIVGKLGIRTLTAEVRPNEHGVWAVMLYNCSAILICEWCMQDGELVCRIYKPISDQPHANILSRVVKSIHELIKNKR